MRSRRIVKSVGLIVTALVIAALSGRYNSTQGRGAYYYVNPHTKDFGVGVKRAIDGDTILLADGRRVRYIGIDTPETKHPYRAAEYYGKEAYLYNKKLVEGKRVRLEFDVEKQDTYDRFLAYVYVGDTFVNARLVEYGYARSYPYPPNVKYAGLFLKLEREARKNNRGLWSPRP